MKGFIHEFVLHKFCQRFFKATFEYIFNNFFRLFLYFLFHRIYPEARPVITHRIFSSAYNIYRGFFSWKTEMTTKPLGVPPEFFFTYSSRGFFRNSSKDSNEIYHRDVSRNSFRSSFIFFQWFQQAILQRFLQQSIQRLFQKFLHVFRHVFSQIFL